MVGDTVGAAGSHYAESSPHTAFQCMGPRENAHVPGRINKAVSASVLSWIFLLTALISQIHGDCWIPTRFY